MSIREITSIDELDDKPPCTGELIERKTRLTFNLYHYIAYCKQHPVVPVRLVIKPGDLTVRNSTLPSSSMISL